MPLTGARTAAIHIIDMDMLDDKIAINRIFLQSLREPPSAESDRCVFKKIAQYTANECHLAMCFQIQQHSTR